MKVKDLIEWLQTLPPDAAVHWEDPNFGGAKNEFRWTDIEYKSKSVWEGDEKVVLVSPIYWESVD